jgi:hypothetical protein
MFAAILSALMGGAGLAAQMSAQNDAQALNWRNFYLQRDTAEENKRLAKATREDALGNKNEYIPGVGFVVRTTPMTKAILNSMQHEMLQRNRVDAPLARKQRLSNATRRGEEDEASRAALAEYRFGPRESEGSFTSDAEDIALRSADRANNETTQALGRQGVRSGNTAAIRDVFKERARQKAESLIDAQMGAKARGSDMFQRQEGRRANTLAQALQLGQSAGQIDQPQFGSDDATQRLQGVQGNQIAGLSDALKWLAQAQGGALNRIADTSMQGGSAMAQAFAQIGQSLGGLDFGSSKAAPTATSSNKVQAQVPTGGDDWYPFPELSALGRQFPERGRGNVGVF